MNFVKVYSKINNTLDITSSNKVVLWFIFAKDVNDITVREDLAEYTAMDDELIVIISLCESTRKAIVKYISSNSNSVEKSYYTYSDLNDEQISKLKALTTTQVRHITVTEIDMINKILGVVPMQKHTINNTVDVKVSKRYDVELFTDATNYKNEYIGENRVNRITFEDTQHYLLSIIHTENRFRINLYVSGVNSSVNYDMSALAYGITLLTDDNCKNVHKLISNVLDGLRLKYASSQLTKADIVDTCKNIQSIIYGETINLRNIKYFAKHATIPLDIL